MAQAGDHAPDFCLSDVAGRKHRLSDYRGKRVILSFFRVDRLKKQESYLRSGGIEVICVFQSPPVTMEKYVMKQTSPPFTMLCDPTLKVYQKFHVKSSKLGFKWGVRRATWNGTIKKCINRGYELGGPVDGKLHRMPADFLIDEGGVIVDVFRARFADEHMAWKRIEAFIPKDTRCTCHREDCLSPECRRQSDLLKKSFGGIFMG